MSDEEFVLPPGAHEEYYLGQRCTDFDGVARCLGISLDTFREIRHGRRKREIVPAVIRPPTGRTRGLVTVAELARIAAVRTHRAEQERKKRWRQDCHRRKRNDQQRNDQDGDSRE